MSYGWTDWTLIAIGSLFVLAFLIYIGLRVYRHLEYLNAERRKETLLMDLQELIFTEWSDELPTNDICAVCIESYAARDRICIFPCQHASHMNCAERWISRCLLRCPQCHGEIVPNSKDYSQEDFRLTPESHRRGRRRYNEETPLLRPTIFQQLNRLTDFTVEHDEPASNELSVDSNS